MSDDDLKLANDAAFDEWGKPATYQVGEGEPFDVIAIYDAERTPAGLGEVATRIGTHIAQVRFGALAGRLAGDEPADGDRFAIGSETFIVRGGDLDRLRDVWTLDLDLQAPP